MDMNRFKELDQKGKQSKEQIHRKSQTYNNNETFLTPLPNQKFEKFLDTTVRPPNK